MSDEGYLRRIRSIDWQAVSGACRAWQETLQAAWRPLNRTADS